MLSHEEFKEEYPPEELEPKLPDRPVASLRDIQYLYGQLYTMATAGGGEYAAYLTPDQAQDLMDEEESIIAVRVDLSGKEPKLAEEPVKVTKYSEDLVEKVAHSKYAAARGIDHSVTHRSGRDSSVEKLARYAKERLTKWANDEAVASAAEAHDQGRIIDELSTLTEDEDVLDRIEEEVNASLSGSSTALLTLQVRLEEGGKYLWPGEVEVFNYAMKERKLDKLVSKNEATDSSGEALDLLTREMGTAVGTAEDPLKYFLGKQMGKFPNFDPDAAWRNHAVSEDSAVTIMNSGTLVEACTYNTFGSTIYYLPYFTGRPTPEKVYELYTLLYSAATQDDRSITPVERAYEDADEYADHGFELRFYVAAVQKHQMSRYDVFGDTMNASLVYPVELDSAHARTLNSWAFDGGDGGNLSPPLPSHENWGLLSGDDFLHAISTGAYLGRTFPEGDDDQDASADDIRIRTLVSILSGDPIRVELLIERYVQHLIDEQQNLLRDSDTDYSFPSYQVASQFAQLCALANAGAESDLDLELLTSRTAPGAEIKKRPNYPEDSVLEGVNMSNDMKSTAQARKEKLDEFIEGTPALSDNPERRGGFLLGALVGQIGSYQSRHEGRGTTVIDQYPIKAMSKNKLKRIVQEVLDKDVVYSRDNGMSSTMYAELVDGIVDTVSKKDPEDWSIGTDDLRFYYSLGVTYGMNNYTQTEETDD